MRVVLTLTQLHSIPLCVDGLAPGRTDLARESSIALLPRVRAASLARGPPTALTAGLSRLYKLGALVHCEWGRLRDLLLLDAVIHFNAYRVFSRLQTC